MINDGKSIMVFNFKIIRFDFVYILNTSIKPCFFDVSLIFNRRYRPNQTDNQSSIIFISIKINYTVITL